MRKPTKTNVIKALFLDIGGVLLTNGWGRKSRDLAAKKFGLNLKEIEARHELVFDALEMDKISLDEYLNMVVFYGKRSFSPQEFKDFMFAESQALDGHIDFFKALKDRYHLKVFALSNECRALNDYRIQHFGLNSLFDAYISSCYVHLRKPDINMLKIACDISQVDKTQALYIDDNAVMAEMGLVFGLQSLHFQGLDNTAYFISTCKFHVKK